MKYQLNLSNIGKFMNMKGSYSFIICSNISNSIAWLNLIFPSDFKRRVYTLVCILFENTCLCAHFEFACIYKKDIRDYIHVCFRNSLKNVFPLFRQTIEYKYFQSLRWRKILHRKFLRLFPYYTYILSLIAPGII